MRKIKRLSDKLRRERKIKDDLLAKNNLQKSKNTKMSKKYESLMSELNSQRGACEETKRLKESLSRIRNMMHLPHSVNNGDLGQYIYDNYSCLQRVIRKLKRKMSYIVKLSKDKDTRIENLKMKYSFTSKENDKLAKSFVELHSAISLVDDLKQTNEFSKLQIERYEEYLSQFFTTFDNFLPRNLSFHEGLHVIQKTIVSQTESLSVMRSHLDEANLRLRYTCEEIEALQRENMRLKEVNGTFKVRLQEKSRHARLLEGELMNLNDLYGGLSSQNHCPVDGSTQTDPSPPVPKCLSELNKLNEKDEQIENTEIDQANSNCNLQSVKSQRDLLAKELKTLKQTDSKTSTQESQPGGDACATMYSTMRNMYQKMKELECENHTLRVGQTQPANPKNATNKAHESSSHLSGRVKWPKMGLNR